MIIPPNLDIIFIEYIESHFWWIMFTTLSRFQKSLSMISISKLALSKAAILPAEKLPSQRMIMLWTSCRRSAPGGSLSIIKDAVQTNVKHANSSEPQKWQSPSINFEKRQKLHNLKMPSQSTARKGRQILGLYKKIGKPKLNKMSKF